MNLNQNNTIDLGLDISNSPPPPQIQAVSSKKTLIRVDERLEQRLDAKRVCGDQSFDIAMDNASHT